MNSKRAKEDKFSEKVWKNKNEQYVGSREPQFSNFNRFYIVSTYLKRKP